MKNEYISKHIPTLAIRFMASFLVAGSITYSGCPSVVPSSLPSGRRFVRASDKSTHQPLPRWMTGIWPSVHWVLSRGFRILCWGPMKCMALKFGILMYPDRLQNILDFGYGLLIFHVLALLELSETGEIWNFLAFSWEWMEGMAWNLTCPCSLATWRADKILAPVFWFSSFWHHFDLVKLVIFEVPRHFLQNTKDEWPEIWHADVFWTPPERIHLDFGMVLLICLLLMPLRLSETGHIWDLNAFLLPGGAEANSRRFVSSSVWLFFWKCINFFQKLIYAAISMFNRIWTSTVFR